MHLSDRRSHPDGTKAARASPDPDDATVYRNEVTFHDHDHPEVMTAATSGTKQGESRHKGPTVARSNRQQRSLLVSATDEQSDPIGSSAKFLLRASAHVDVRDPVLMTYLVYFTKSQAAQRARAVAAQVGWRATLFAVPEAYVLRLPRRRLLTDGQLAAERDEVLHISSTYDGDWRYVLVEQTAAQGAWERLAEEVASQAATTADVPAQRSVPAAESKSMRTGRTG